jgi:hypothetical protein
VVLYGGIGQDYFGEMLSAHCEAFGVNLVKAEVCEDRAFFVCQY